MAIETSKSLSNIEIKSSLTKPASGIKVQYSKESEECSYYVYPSKGGPNSPILIWVESFSYLHNEMADFEDFALKLSSEGVTLIRLNYRINDNEGKLKFTNFIQDGVIGFLNIVNDIKFKDNDIYIGGHCSGALLACLIALDSGRFLPLISKDKGLELSLISKIKGIVALAGTFDLSQVSLENDFFKLNIAAPVFAHSDSIQPQKQEYYSKYEATLNSDYNSYYNVPQPVIPPVSNTNKLITNDDNIQKKIITAPVLNDERLVTKGVDIRQRLLIPQPDQQRINSVSQYNIQRDDVRQRLLIPQPDQQRINSTPNYNKQKMAVMDNGSLLTKDEDRQRLLIPQPDLQRLLIPQPDLQRLLIPQPDQQRLLIPQPDQQRLLIPQPDQQRVHSIPQYNNAKMTAIDNDSIGNTSPNQSNYGNGNNFNSEQIGINKLLPINQVITLSSNNGNNITNYIVPNGIPIVINERIISIGGNVQSNNTLNKVSSNIFTDNPNGIKDERMYNLPATQSTNNFNLSGAQNNTLVSNPSIQNYNIPNLPVPQNIMPQAINSQIDVDFLNYLKSISPQYITSTSLSQIPYELLPKILVMHSTNDSLVHSGHSLNFIKHLNNLGFNRIRFLANNFGDHNLIHKDPIVVQSVLNFVIPGRVSPNLLSSKL